MPRLPARYRPKRKWRLAAQADPLTYLEEEASWPESSWREHTERVVKVLEDQTSRGQLIKLLEAEARARHPNLVISSLGANRKDKPNGEISARVFFDGTNGLQVNTGTRLRDQERSPIAEELKRAMREKATMGVRTFALTADVKEAHRQVPIHPRDWHLLGAGSCVCHFCGFWLVFWSFRRFQLRGLVWSFS